MDAEYEQLCKRVAVINVAVERQIQVKGPDAEKFVDFVITRKASAIKVRLIIARCCSPNHKQLILGVISTGGFCEVCDPLQY